MGCTTDYVLGTSLWRTITPATADRSEGTHFWWKIRTHFLVEKSGPIFWWKIKTHFWWKIRIHFPVKNQAPVSGEKSGPIFWWKNHDCRKIMIVWKVHLFVGKLWPEENFTWSSENYDRRALISGTDVSWTKKGRTTNDFLVRIIQIPFKIIHFPIKII